jgi:hypothetical protein
MCKVLSKINSNRNKIIYIKVPRITSTLKGS